MRSLPALFNHAHGYRIELQRAVAVPLRPLHPAHRIRIRGRLQLPARHAAQVVGNHIVVADALALAMNAVQQLDQFDRLNRSARSLPSPRAPPRPASDFAHFKHAAGQRPLALQRLGSAPHQQHPPSSTTTAPTPTSGASGNSRCIAPPTMPNFLYDSALACLRAQTARLAHYSCQADSRASFPAGYHQINTGEQECRNSRCESTECTAAPAFAASARLWPRLMGFEVKRCAWARRGCTLDLRPCARRSCHCRSGQGRLPRAIWKY